MRVSLLLLLLTLPVSAFGQTAAPVFRPTQIPEAAIEAVLATMSAETSDPVSAPSRDDVRASLRATAADLNRDGTSELLVEVVAGGPLTTEYCGSGGCSSWLLQRVADGSYVVIKNDLGSLTPLARRTGGWSDLVQHIGKPGLTSFTYQWHQGAYEVSEMVFPSNNGSTQHRITMRRDTASRWEPRPERMWLTLSDLPTDRRDVKVAAVHLQCAPGDRGPGNTWCNSSFLVLTYSTPPAPSPAALARWRSWSTGAFCADYLLYGASEILDRGSACRLMTGESGRKRNGSVYAVHPLTLMPEEWEALEDANRIDLRVDDLEISLRDASPLHVFRRQVSALSYEQPEA